MEKTKVILLGDNIVSNILKILLNKQKIDYVNFIPLKILIFFLNKKKLLLLMNIPDSLRYSI